MTQGLVQRGNEIVPVGGGPRWAVIDARNVLDVGARDLPPDERTVLWSGWMGAGDPQRAVFERDFRTWLPEAWSRLEAAMAEATGRVMLRPHARHVLSDAQSCVTFFTKHPGIGLLLDPVALLTPEMLRSAEDHLDRIVGSLSPRADAVIIRGADLIATDWGDELGPGSTALRIDTVRAAVDRLAPPDLPRITV